MALDVRQPEIFTNTQTSRTYPKKTGKLIIQLDELWSFVESQDNKQSVWLAMDAATREIIGVCVGARSRSSGKRLWQSLPTVYRQCAVCYPDFW